MEESTGGLWRECSEEVPLAKAEEARVGGGGGGYRW